MKIFKIFPAVLILCLLLGLCAPCALALDGPELSARAVLLADLASGAVLYEKNGDEARSPASLTKVMTILLALEAVERGEARLDDAVTAGSDCRSGMRDDSSSVGILPGEILSLRDLLYCAAVASGNDACNVIAAYIAGSIPAFVERMNGRAGELGCSATHFVDPNGLSYEDLSSARDLYRITLEALRHPDFMELCDCSSYLVSATNKNASRQLKSSNALLTPDGIYGAGYLYEGAHGIKTGYTRAAGYCLISTAQQGEMTLLAIVLGSDGPYLSNTETRYSFVDTARLYDWAFSGFAFRQLCTAGQPLADREASLARGDGSLALLAGADLRLPLPADAEPVLQLELADPELRAPIEAGQRLGSAVFLLDGRELARVDLNAGRSIERSLWAYMADTVRRYQTENGSYA